MFFLCKKRSVACGKKVEKCVDLCKQGANQRAFICLKKSVEEGNSVSDIKTSMIQNVCKELNISIEDVCKALGFSIQQEETQEQKIKKAMEKSLWSVQSKKKKYYKKV